MVGMGFSKAVLRGSWLGKAVEESGPVGGSCKPKGPEAGTSWVCSRNRKEALTVGPFTSLHTAPRPPEAQLLMHGGQEPMPQLGYKHHSLLTAPVFACPWAGHSRRAEETPWASLYPTMLRQATAQMVFVD